MRWIRKLFFWLLDVAAIVVVVACILHFSRRQTIRCAWEGMRASCTLEAENSLGRINRTRIDGIRGAAYRLGKVVGLITDATNKDELALFGTRVIDLRQPADAVRLYAFADDRVPDRITIEYGTEHPLRMTVAWFAALLAYALLSGRVRAFLARREA